MTGHRLGCIFMYTFIMYWEAGNFYGMWSMSAAVFNSPNSPPELGEVGKLGERKKMPKDP